MQNPYQLTQLAYDAGFRANRTELVTSVAAAIGESRGNERARGDGGDSWGLWQINLPSHPEYRSNPERLYDPRTNADAAYKVYVSAGRTFEPFHAWSHASRAERAVLTSLALGGVTLWEASHPAAALGTIVKPATDAAGEKAGGVVDSVTGGISNQLQSLDQARKWITTPANVGRLAIGVAGVIVVIAGLIVLASPVVDKAVSTVATVKP